MLTYRQRLKLKRGTCVAHSCTACAAPGRVHCYKHRSREYAQRRPLMYKFNAIRLNARRRGKEFTITFDYFERLAIESGYDKLSGRKSESLTLDRIDESKGYVPGNVQVITNRANIRKRYGYQPETAYQPSDNVPY